MASGLVSSPPLQPLHSLQPLHPLQPLHSLPHLPASPHRWCSSRQELYTELVEEELGAEEGEEVAGLVDRYLHTAAMAHQVLVIQPFIRLGPHRKQDTSPDLMLAESRALAATLDWRVVDTVTIGLNSFKKKLLFGSGNLEMLRARVAANPKVTAVFVSLYQLTAVQRLELEATVQVPVIDRYHLVLQIFHRHARTKEARLQVALAELPYLRGRLMVDHHLEQTNKHSGGNLGEQHFDRQRSVLRRLEGGIKRRIAGVRQQRERERAGRRRAEVPTVAVVGYTNCGKTSLIKAVTAAALEPRDALFATLDVTCHRATLPDSNLEVVFMDTVGFISDIPTALIASFSSTLEDALAADLVVHVRDISHPDTEHQHAQVLATLARLGLKDPDSLVTVGNKMDLVAPEEWRAWAGRGCLPVSATQGLGLPQLLARLVMRLMAARGLTRVTVRVRPASPDHQWLWAAATVVGEKACPRDACYSLLTVILSTADRRRFQARLARVEEDG